MVLSAGLGTRLGAVSQEVPKPLLPVGDRPLLVSLLEGLRAAGASDLATNVFHLSDKIVSQISYLPFNVHVSVEGELLGTAGGIFRARKSLKAVPLVCVNGDFYGTPPITQLLVAGPADLVLATVPRETGRGTVGIGREGEVVRLRGRVVGEEVRSGDYLGVARLSAETLETLPERGCLIGDWAIPHMGKAGRIRAISVTEEFIDIGTPEGYLQANLEWLSQRRREAFVADTAWVSPHIQLEGSVVGPGASVEGEGSVRRTIVLPGAAARAPLSGAIVLPSGRVVEVA